MILVTKLNDEKFTLNCELFETVFENPDTTIRLTNGHIYIVKESMEEVIEKTVVYKKEIFQNEVNNRL